MAAAEEEKGGIQDSFGAQVCEENRLRSVLLNSFGRMVILDIVGHVRVGGKQWAPGSTLLLCKSLGTKLYGIKVRGLLDVANLVYM